MLHRKLAQAEGSGSVDFPNDLDWSDGLIILSVSQNLNSTNHMRPTEGGAFPLPSVARMIVLPSPHSPPCEKSRQHAIEYDYTNLPTADSWRLACDLVNWSTSTVTRCRGLASSGGEGGMRLYPMG